MFRFRTVLLVLLVLLVWLTSIQAQEKPKPPTIEQIGENRLKLGSIIVDTNARTVSVPGFVNPDVSVLEFFANTRGGFKNYESALELDTDAISFNTALLLIGLDNRNAVPAKFPFQPEPPKGDSVEIFLEWKDSTGKQQKRPIEELVYNTVSKETLKPGNWVYTGSVFMEDGTYMAEMEGVLITFVHHPSPIIDYSGEDGNAQYGTVILRPDVGLDENLPVKLTVRAVGKEVASR